MLLLLLLLLLLFEPSCNTEGALTYTHVKSDNKKTPLAVSISLITSSSKIQIVEEPFWGTSGSHNKQTITLFN